MPQAPYDSNQTYRTTAEAARDLGVGLTTIRTAVAEDRITFVRIVGRLLFTSEAIEEYRKRTRGEGNVKPTGRPKKT